MLNNSDSIVVYQSEFQRQSDLFWMEFFQNHPWIPMCFLGFLGIVVVLIFGKVFWEICGVHKRIRSKW